jgi:hypothetical protein
MRDKTARLWVAAIMLMGVCVLATGWYPLLSITALPSKSYNEGWNAYRQWMAFEGQPLYGTRDALWTTNYPFLSFHVIGLIGRAKGHMVLAGRAVCFAALVVICVLAGAIVRRATGSRAGAVYAALCLFAGLGAFNGNGRAVDDPELLSAAFAMVGLFAYMSGPGILWAGLAAAAFAVSLFTKHDFIGFPLSVAVHLLVTRNWRGSAVYLGTGVFMSGALLALSRHLDGPYFFAAFLQSRAYYFRNLVAETLHYLLHFSLPLLVAAVLLWHGRTMPQRGLLIILLLVTNILAVGFAGGDGVAANIFYPPLMAVLLTCAIGMCWLEQNARQWFGTALIIVTMTVALMVPFQLAHDIADQRHMAAATQAAQQSIALLAAAKGPAICEDLLLCYEAGKALDFDPYYVRDQIATGRVPEARIIALLDDHHYGAIQLSRRIESQASAQRYGRFTPAFLRVLIVQYRPVFVSRDDLLFEPSP